MKMENLETIQVALRIRPLVESEINKGCEISLETVAQSQVVVRNLDKAFTFNYVFGPEDSQECFYSTAVKHLVMRLFKGYNVTVLAYGQTGSGKTFSIGTGYVGEGEKGVIPRAIDDIFDKIMKMSDWDFKITVSFVELYKEQLYDLLATTRCTVDIREDSKGIRIPGLTEKVVTSPMEMLECLVQGSSGRATGATAMNAQSSRSHAIFTINIEMTKLGEMNNVLNAKFHLVDLAGSERPKKTKAIGERFQEGVNINRGLLALGNVISALGEGVQSYIGYRDSKLTRLLQDSLGGNSLTLMIACVSPADYNLQETLSTLRYADRARQIKNKPIVNHDPHTAEVLSLKKQLQELRMQLVQGDGPSCPPEHQRLQEENVMLLSKTRNFTEQLNELLNQNVHLVERAHLAEQARARMQLKMSELQADYDLTLGGLNQSIENLNNCPAEFVEQLRKLSLVQQKIKEIQQEQQRDSAELLNHELSSAACGRTGESGEDDEGTAGDIEEKRGMHVMQQARLNQELQELTRALALKEELASKLVANADQMATVREEYALNQEAVENLKKEKEHLQQELSKAQAANCGKSAEQWRKQIQELEHKISALNKKILNQAKVIKMKEKSDEKINTLQTEIQAMKSAKVRLIRQMKAEGDRFKTWRQERERELIKLKDQDRKRQNQLVRMERLHAKQQNVLKRKFEESVAINKRLKDALALQRTVQERRNAKGDITSRVQAWVSQELEVLVSTVAAEQTLLELIEDRGVLTTQLNQVRAQLDQGAQVLSPEEEAALREEKRQLEEDMEMRSIQIADMQQKIADSDQDNKGKTRWESLQSMVEAKCALGYLFEVAADVKKELSSKVRRLSELEDALRTCKMEAKGFQENLRQLTARHQEEFDKLEREHQNKVFMLLNQLRGVKPESGDKMLQERIQILEQSFEHLEALQKKLEEREEELISVRSLLDQRSAELEEVKQKIDRKRTRHSLHKQENRLEAVAARAKLEAFGSDNSFVDDALADPDWQKTPIFHKIQKLKRVSCIQDVDRGTKRNVGGQIKCNCKGKGKCVMKNCGCRKAGLSCNQDCRCRNCLNRDENEDRRIEMKLSFCEDSTYDDEDQSNTDSKRSRTLSSIENTMDCTSKMKEEHVRYFPAPDDMGAITSNLSNS